MAGADGVVGCGVGPAANRSVAKKPRPVRRAGLSRETGSTRASPGRRSERGRKGSRRAGGGNGSWAGAVPGHAAPFSADRRILLALGTDLTPDPLGTVRRRLDRVARGHPHLADRARPPSRAAPGDRLQRRRDGLDFRARGRMPFLEKVSRRAAPALQASDAAKTHPNSLRQRQPDRSAFLRPAGLGPPHA